MKKHKVKIELCPPGIAEGAIPSVKDRYFTSWRLEVVGEGKGKDLHRENYLRGILKGI